MNIFRAFASQFMFNVQRLEAPNGFTISMGPLEIVSYSLPLLKMFKRNKKNFPLVL